MKVQLYYAKSVIKVISLGEIKIKGFQTFY